MKKQRFHIILICFEQFGFRSLNSSSQFYVLVNKYRLFMVSYFRSQYANLYCNDTATQNKTTPNTLLTKKYCSGRKPRQRGRRLKMPSFSQQNCNYAPIEDGYREDQQQEEIRNAQQQGLDNSITNTMLQSSSPFLFRAAVPFALEEGGSADTTRSPFLERRPTLEGRRTKKDFLLSILQDALDIVNDSEDDFEMPRVRSASPSNDNASTGGGSGDISESEEMKQ